MFFKYFLTAPFIVSLLLESSAFATTCLDAYKKSPDKYRDEIALMEELEQFKGQEIDTVLESLLSKELQTELPEISNFFVNYSCSHSTHALDSPLKKSVVKVCYFTEAAAKLFILYRNNEFCKNPDRPMNLQTINNVFFLLQGKKGAVGTALRDRYTAVGLSCPWPQNLPLETDALLAPVVEYLKKTQATPHQEFSDKVAKLLVENDPQGAIWAAREEGHQQLANSIRDWFKDKLLSSEYEEVKEHGLTGWTQKRILVFPNGQKALFKPDGTEDPEEGIEKFAANSNSEVAASRLNDLFGMSVVPITEKVTLKNGEKGSVQYFLPKTKQVSDLDLNLPSENELSILDYVTGKPVSDMVTIPDNPQFNTDGTKRTREYDLRNYIKNYIERNNYYKKRDEKAFFFDPKSNRYVSAGNGMAFRGFSSATAGNFENDSDNLRVILEYLNPNVKKRIQSLSDKEISEKLGNLVHANVLRRVLVRIHNLKTLLAGGGPKLLNTTVAISDRLSAPVENEDELSFNHLTECFNLLWNMSQGPDDSAFERVSELLTKSTKEVILKQYEELVKAAYHNKQSGTVIKLVQLLQKRDIPVQNFAVYYATEQNDEKTLEFLLENGGNANLNVSDVNRWSNSKSLLEFAISQKKPEVLTLLVKHGAKVESQHIDQVKDHSWIEDDKKKQLLSILEPNLEPKL